MHGGLTGVVVLFGGALLTAWLMRAVRLPTILGFLAAGVGIGPWGLDLIHPEKIEFFADLGLVLLLFTVGLELSPEPLFRLGLRVAFAATIQIAAAALGIAVVGHLVLDMSWPTALLIAGIVSMSSSTAIVLKHLSDRGTVDTPVGMLLVGISVFQDIAVIFVLAMLPLLAGHAAAGQGWPHTLGRSGLALAGLVGVTCAARLVLPWITRQVARFGGRELMTLFAVFMAGLGAWCADWADWSWSLGACITGLLLGQTDLRHQLQAEIMPFRDVLNALFFMTIGMMADLAFAAAHPILLAVLVLGVLLLKAASGAVGVLVSGWPLRLAVVVGIGLSTISEFGYVLAAEAARLGLLPAEHLPPIITVTVGTMLVGALLMPASERFADGLSALFRPRKPQPAAVAQPGSAPTSHVIIVGYGVNGQNLARVLRSTGIPYFVVEMNRRNAHTAREEGARVIVGDAARLSILQSAGLATARALVISIAEQWATRRITAQAHAARPDLYILARTRFVTELEVLYRLGARQVIPEEFETSIEIFAHVLKEFAIPDNVVEQQVRLIRGGRYGMLRGRPSDRTLRTEWMRILEAAVTQTYMLLPGSGACGRTIRELDLRARTGVTIAALTRQGKALTNPDPSFRLQEGDVLVLVGNHKQLDAAKSFLDPPPADEAAES